MDSISERFEKKFQKSGELFQRGVEVVGGGSHGSRAMDPYPIYVKKAKGALKWDVDGNEIIDYVIGFGSLLLGNSHPTVTEAVEKQLSQGTHMGTGTELELKWAEQVRDLIPSAERVRFTASGTESTLLAIRLARGFTGKTKLVKFHEHFHGWHDYVSMDSGINTQIGIPSETLSTVVVLQPDISVVKRALEEDRDIAAVIVEPTGGHWGQFPLQNPTFLEELRKVTTQHNVVMIMDEVICGFRLSKHGAQGRFGIKPDMTTMAKVLAGGLPGGAVAGRADIMELVNSDDPSLRLTHPGTFNANPVSAAAGIATLEIVKTGIANQHADDMAARLKEGLRDALSKMEVPAHVHGISSIVHVALGVDCDCTGEICSLPHDQLAQSTNAKNNHLKVAMLNEGVDMMGSIGFMTSATHTPDQIDRTAEAFEHALSALREDQLI